MRLDEETQNAIRKALEAEPGVRLAYLFGSFARGEAGPGSDLDVAVVADRELGLLELGALVERLQRAAAGLRVDLMDLRRAAPLARFQVVRDGQVLVERDPVARFEFERAAWREAQDTRHLRRVQQDLLREAARHGDPR